MSFNFTKAHTPRSYAARTDVGSVREHNEDSYLAKSPLFVIADGMGGHEAGEVASKIAIDTMDSLIPKGPNAEELMSAVIEANAAVLRGAEDGTGKPGMGTTLTSALIFDHEVIVAQVGDSRAYLLHDNTLHRITRDHSLVADLIEQGRLTEAEARFHPQRSVITRALGSDSQMQPDLYTINVEMGDRLLLCSDGLSSMITDATIETLLVANPEPAQACDALVDEALAAGGLDNVSVIVIDPLGEPPEEAVIDKGDFVEERVVGKPVSKPDSGTPLPVIKKRKRKGRFAPLIWAVAFVLILAAAGFGFYTYAQNSYYLIVENGVVNVYRGLPGHIGTLSVSWLEEEASDIDVSKLSPTTQNRLANGISVNSIDEANSLLSEYRQTTGDARTVQNNVNSSAAASASQKATSSSTGITINQESGQN
jgi:serine/threonine protein phosphatase PrpC